MLQIGDVGADADCRAIGRAVVADADPAFVRKRHLEGGARRGAQPQALGEPGFALARGNGNRAGIDDGAHDVGKAGAGSNGGFGAGKEVDEFPVGEDEAVLGVEEGEALGDAFDCLSELALRLRRPLPGLVLLGHIPRAAAEAEELARGGTEDRQARDVEEAFGAVAVAHRERYVAEWRAPRWVERAFVSGELAQREEGAADELDRLESQYLGDAWRDEGEAEVPVGLPDPVGGKAGDVFEPVVGERELVASRMKLARLLDHAEYAFEHPVRTADAAVAGAEMDRRRRAEGQLVQHRRAAAFELGDDLRRREER